MNTILKVENLSTSFYSDKKEFEILKNISFNLKKGRILGIVGESGCGKSITVNSIINLLPNNAKITKGEVKFIRDEEIDLVKLKQYGKDFRKIRGESISMIFQDPLSALNPVHTIGAQIIEVLLEHFKISKKEALEKAIDLLEKLGIKNAKDRINQYPHEFSGGQRQRVIIAIAMICDPEILIADEPTTALDVTIQAQILDLIKDLQEQRHTSIIITHNLGVVCELADDIAVMYAGEIVELAPTKELFSNPTHPYTRLLLNSIPQLENDGKKLNTIKGIVPSVDKFIKTGCRFADRILWIDKSKHEQDPTLHEVRKDHFVRCTCYKDFHFESSDEIKPSNKIYDEVVLEVLELKKHYEFKSFFFSSKKPTVKALDNVNFRLLKGQSIGIVGESGSGKSTLAKSLMKLHDITSGEIRVQVNNKLQNIYSLKGKDDLAFRKKIQMVFQDPYSSLNPMKKIVQSFYEPMKVHGIQNIDEKIEELLEMLHLNKDCLDKYPHEFSGGQRQRIAIARALCLDPDILILDEAVSALDLSVQAQVLNYLLEIKAAKELSFIFISHDLGVIKYMCDQIYVIHNGRFVEIGPTKDIYENPQHIYTKKLLAAIPEISIEKNLHIKEKRLEIEQELQRDFSLYYKENGSVYDLKPYSPKHYVAIK